MSEIAESTEKKKKRRGHRRPVVIDTKSYTGIDKTFLILVILLLLIGLACLYSASYMDAYYDKNMKPYTYVLKQGIFAAGGFVIMLYVAHRDYRRYRFAGTLLMILSFVLLGSIKIVPGMWQTINKATRWINVFGLFSFQPSEITKLAFIMFFADYVSRMGRKRMRHFVSGIGLFIILMGATAVLLKLQPHLSATVIIALVGGVIIFLGGASVLQLSALGGLAGTGLALYLMTHKYAMKRIDVWFDPFSDFRNSGWQGAQSQMAIASGGLWGLGFGQSRQKHGFLPEAPNDFIFSVILEELGLVGGLLIIGLFVALIIRGYYIAAKADDKYGTLLAAGITTQIAAQTIINMGVVSGLLPVTGAALPFFSYGGTSLVILLIEVGILLSVSRRRIEEDEDK